MTRLQVVVTILASAAVFLGALFAGARFLWKAAGTSAAHQRAVEDNTRATQDLSAELHQFSSSVNATLEQHERRLVLIEDRLPRA